MNKVKIFLNPVEGREKYINEMANKGYRLVKSGSIIQSFEKDNRNYKYSVQYIGHMNNKERKEYIDFLKSLNLKTFSAPINIGKVSLGNIRLRPYNSPKSMIATYPGMINKELLIIESNKKENIPIFTDRESKAEDIRRRKAPYYYLLVASVILAGLGFFKITDIKSIILAGVLFIIAFIGLYKFNIS